MGKFRVSFWVLVFITANLIASENPLAFPFALIVAIYYLGKTLTPLLDWIFAFLDRLLFLAWDVVKVFVLYPLFQLLKRRRE